MQDKLEKNNLHDDIKKINEPITVIVKDVFKNTTQTLTETSKVG